MPAILASTRRQVNAKQGMVREPTLWILQFREQPREGTITGGRSRRLGVILSMASFKKLVFLTLGVCFVLGLIVLQNVVAPPAFVPDLTEGFWSGYYELELFGKVWCLAKFYREEYELRMVVMTVADTSEIFLVERDTSDPTVVHLKMKARDFDETIEAKQLYLGKRYLWGRLFAGRFRDFWKRNDDDAIRGHFVSSKSFFGLERRLEGQDLVQFYNNYVLGKDRYATLDEIDAVVEEAKHRPPITDDEVLERLTDEKIWEKLLDLEKSETTNPD